MATTPNYGWPVPDREGIQRTEIDKVKQALVSADQKVKAVDDALAAQIAAFNAHTHSFASLTGRPTTLAGYGITDAYTKTAADTAIANAVAALINSAPATLDTFAEIATALGNDPNLATTLTTLIGQKLAKDQNLNDLPNKATARANLGADAAYLGKTAQAADSAKLGGVAAASYVVTSRSVKAGSGLTGGGALSADVTLAVSFGTAAGTAAQGNDSRIVNAVPNTRKVIGGTGLSNGGALSSDVTLNVLYGTAAGTAAQGNDSRIVNAVQTSRQITAGNGLTGGGTLAADRSLAVGAGTGITVAATAVSVDGTVWRDGNKPTGAMIGSVLASMDAVSIGSYALLRFVGTGEVLQNQTAAGSDLVFSNASGSSTGAAPTGTWRNHGRSIGSGTADRTSVFKRIS